MNELAPEEGVHPEIAAYSLMDEVYSVLKGQGRVFRPSISRVPSLVGDRYVMRLYGILYDKKKVAAGEIRVRLEVPVHAELPIRVSVDWTRDMLGFWYRDTFEVDNEGLPLDEIGYYTGKSARAAGLTANRSVSLASMNRSGWKKIRRNIVRDKVSRSGMAVR